jgi:AcrR family transcriptional regulator
MNEVPDIEPASVPTDLEAKLRNVPSQARSRARLKRVLDSADEVLATDGTIGFTTTRIAEAAGIPVGSVYHYFPDKEAIVEALAVGYWSDFEYLVSGVADTDERDPLEDPCRAIIEVLAAGFRASPGFRTLWYGGLRTEQVRNATRPTRTAIARSVARILAVHWPDAETDELALAARMVVLAGDGLLREAFRVDPHGDEELLRESTLMLDAYVAARLGPTAASG